MSNSDFRKDRRDALGLIAGSVVIIPIAALLPARATGAEDLPHLAEDDPTAKALRYVHDATTAERTKRGATPGENSGPSTANWNNPPLPT